jgi:hypothetical protein
VSAARNRATSSFAAMSSVGEPAGGEPAPAAGGRPGVRPAPANAGGGTGGAAGPTRPLKLPELTERGSDA